MTLGNLKPHQSPARVHVAVAGEGRGRMRTTRMDFIWGRRFNSLYSLAQGGGSAWCLLAALRASALQKSESGYSAQK